MVLIMVAPKREKMACQRSMAQKKREKERDSHIKRERERRDHQGMIKEREGTNALRSKS